HLVAAGELGQVGRRQRAVPQGVPLGRQEAHSDVQRRLHRGQARASAPHALRTEGLLRRTRRGGSGFVRRALAVALAGLATVRAVAFAGADARDPASTYANAPFEPSYTPPAPGSYELPPIDTVSDHPIVDADGKDTTLFSAIGDRMAVVSFIYGTCSEKT